MKNLKKLTKNEMTLINGGDIGGALYSYYYQQIQDAVDSLTNAAGTTQDIH